MTARLLKEVSALRILALIVLMVVANALEVVGLSLFIPIIELMQSNAAEAKGITRHMLNLASKLGLPQTLTTFLCLLSALFFVKAALTMWLRYVSVTTASGLQDRVRSRIFSGLLYARVGFVTGNRQGELLSVLSEHTVRVSIALFLLIQIVAQWIAVFAYTGFVLSISWQLTLLTMGLGIFVAPGIRAIGRKAQAAGRGYTLAFEDLQHRAIEALSAKKAINAMNWTRQIERRFEVESRSLRHFWQWTAFWSNSPGILMQPLAVAILSLIILFSLRFELSVALLGTFSLACIRLIPNVQAAVTMGVDLQSNRSSVERVSDMLESMDKVREPNGTRPYKGLQQGIRLREVRFSYDASSLVLAGVNLDVPKGKTVALVGPSGAGKTTIADLILGLYQPVSGELSVDGLNLADIDLRQYRTRIAYVPQESVMFHDSIRNNLTLGLERDVSEDEIENACQSAGAWEFISQRKGRLDETIGERGAALSGGQRQRLALARALLRQPDILVLDEATSALDQESEQWIQRTLRELQAAGTVAILVIAHRYTTIEHADSIYEVRDGVATHLGNWEQAQGRLATNSSAFELI